LRPGENHPAIESGPAGFTTAAGFDAQIRDSLLDHIAEPDIMINDESGEADAVRLALLVFVFPAHNISTPGRGAGQKHTNEQRFWQEK
jgi:hypothetical protein